MCPRGCGALHGMCGRLELCVTIGLSYGTAFAAALMTVLNLLVFSFEASHSNSFGKAFIQLGALVKLDSQQDR